MNHRVHPLTPVLRAWSFIIASIIFAVTTFSDYTFDLVHRLLSNDRTETLQAAGIIGAGVVIAAGASLLWWRATSYTVTDIDIVFRWGLIRRKIRSARLDRTQAIDVVQPFHARLFGLAAVRIETAGGHNSRIEVRYLKRRAAENLKKQLLGQFTEGELLVPPIPIYRSLLASLFSLSAFISLVLTLTSMGFDIHLAALLPVFVSTIPNIWRTIDGSYQFTAHRVGDTINVSYGLANLQRKTLNMSRVHAISLRKTALWRPFGWWRVQVTVAGYGERSDGMTILPVGDKRTAMMLCELLTGCRVDPDQPAHPQFRSPARAFLVSPIDFRRQTFELTDDCAIEHRGFFGHRAAIVFRRHIQEFGVFTGPIQRITNISTVKLHLVQGPVSMSGRDLNRDDAQRLLWALHGHCSPAL